MTLSQAAGPRPVAAVITEWRRNSHADVLLARLLEPSAWGHARPFKLKLAAVYADQFPENDLCRSYCQKHGVPVFPSVRGAIGVGSSQVQVDGVILIGEHGDYPHNQRHQQLYPRRRLFEQVVDAFRVLGKRVPVFNDKHLSYDWLLARWMYDLARHEVVPFLAGSSLPVAWRSPPLALPLGVELDEALAVGHGESEAYGFHALEALQCMVERRQGGETGVAAVKCLSGPAVLEAIAESPRKQRLLDAALASFRDTPSRRGRPGRNSRPSPRDNLYQIQYQDGLEASVAMLGSVGECFAFAGQRRGTDELDATTFALEMDRPFGHFGHLLRAIESMIATGRPPYPVERTLLTTGALDALLQSREQGGATIKTPHLAAVKYEPTDWPHAAGPSGTPA